jgi:hypothetical protein
MSSAVDLNAVFTLSLSNLLPGKYSGIPQNVLNPLNLKEQTTAN